MTINETDMRGHVTWYIQYLRNKAEWVVCGREVDKK